MMTPQSVVRKMVANHDCLHEELIQDHSLQLTELETKSRYKEQSIMEIKEDLKELNNKLDILTADVNKVIRKSESTDSKLEKRVETLETKIHVYETFFKETKEDNDKRNNKIIAIAAVTATVIGILIKFI